MKTFSKDRLLAVMLQKGYTNTRLAKESGISEASVSHYISGTRSPGAKTILKMADVLDVSVDYLYCRDAMQEELKRAKDLISRNAFNMSDADRDAVAAVLRKPNSVRFADSLMEIMKEKGMDEETLTKEAVLENGDVSSYLEGERIPMASDALRMADTLGVSVEYLLGRRETCKTEEGA